MKLRTGWDIDGVGFNFGESVRSYLEHTGQGHLWKSGPNPEPYWDFFKDWGWTSKQFVEFCNAGADAGFIFAGDVRPGYVESIERVARLGHEVVIATDRPFGSSPEVSQRLTEEWLAQHGIEFDELHYTAQKSSAGADVFVDDKLENYDELVANGCVAFLLNRPWNKVEGGDARNRINHVSEFADAIENVTKLGYLDLPFA